ncbi:uncharacterized protein UDID_18933 [Ustilago sp. UG-2017a]|nr:uncharacterized protein UDID_18933 [Ustilago sp. UG-2017a]
MTWTWTWTSVLLGRSCDGRGKAENGRNCGDDELAQVAKAGNTSRREARRWKVRMRPEVVEYTHSSSVRQNSQGGATQADVDRASSYVGPPGGEEGTETTSTRPFPRSARRGHILTAQDGSAMVSRRLGQTRGCPSTQRIEASKRRSEEAAMRVLDTRGTHNENTK